ASVAWASFRPPQRALRELLAFSSVCALSAPVIDTVATGVGAAWDTGAMASANVGFLATGVCLLGCLRALPPDVMRLAEPHGQALNDVAPTEAPRPTVS